MAQTLVLYYIPSDRDDFETPNAFKIPKSVEEISEDDLHAFFPLPGKYHFRIKQGSVWADLTKGVSLAQNGGRIFLKVLRLSWEKEKISQKAPGIVSDFDSFFN